MLKLEMKLDESKEEYQKTYIKIIEKEKPLSPKTSGIGDLSIEADFVISDGSGNYY